MRKNNTKSMKSSRYLYKRSLIAVTTSPIIIIFGSLLIALSTILLGFVLWADGKTVDETLLPIGKNLPVFYDINGTEIEYVSDNFISSDEIPADLKNAFVALEDKRFYSHNGYDTYRILGATIKNIKSGRTVEGASTITQQLAKNTHLTFEKTLTRKANEIALATKLEEMYTKDEILSMYLSVIYFGGGAYGVKSASKFYFGKDIADLSLAECATLAGIIKNPSKYAPHINLDNAIERRNHVLSVMYEEGYITKADCQSAQNQRMQLSTKKESNQAKFFIDCVINELCDELNITKYQLDNSGYKIYTTYDPLIQDILAKNAILTSNFSSDSVQSSTIVIDNKNGNVLAYHSSAGYEVFARCGSTLKPLVVYAPALENNLINLATPINDEVVSYGNWQPKNYKDIYVGTTNPREGIKHSSNTVAVRIGSYVGETQMYEYGKKFGLNLSENDKNLSLALGSTSLGQSPLTIAGAYSCLARNGEYERPSFVRFVVDDNRKIYSSKKTKQKIISTSTAFLINDCLFDTVKDGTAKGLYSLPFALCSKTGTVAYESATDGKNFNSDLNSDAWNTSFNNAYTVVVWHGGKHSETGGGHPTIHARSIWKSLYEANKSEFDYSHEQPDDVVYLPVDTYSTRHNMQATLASQHTTTKYTKWEYFKASNTPVCKNSMFENCPVSLYVSLIDNKVKLSFDTKEIYDYVVTRKDILGNKQIAKISGKDDASILFYDSPLLIGKPIKYTLEAYVKGTHHMVGSDTKTVIA